MSRYHEYANILLYFVKTLYRNRSIISQQLMFVQCIIIVLSISTSRCKNNMLWSFTMISSTSGKLLIISLCELYERQCSFNVSISQCKKWEWAYNVTLCLLLVDSLTALATTLSPWFMSHYNFSTFNSVAIALEPRSCTNE